MLSGGLDDALHVREVFAATGADAVMLARGALGNPWLFEELLSGREEPPTRAEVLGELDWTISRAVEHVGERRATRYLRKFYPWYIARLELGAAQRSELLERVQEGETLEQVQALLGITPREQGERAPS